jgi:hypothetical protein
VDINYRSYNVKLASVFCCNQLFHSNVIVSSFHHNTQHACVLQVVVKLRAKTSGTALGIGTVIRRVMTYTGLTTMTFEMFFENDNPTPCHRLRHRRLMIHQSPARLTVLHYDGVWLDVDESRMTLLKH